MRYRDDIVRNLGMSATLEGQSLAGCALPGTENDLDNEPQFLEQPDTAAQRITMAPLARTLRTAEGLRLITTSSDDWNAYLGQVPHYFFHRSEYHRIQEQFGHGEACMAVYAGAGRFVLWPYLLHDIHNAREVTGRKLRDASSVYGYSGPLIYNCADDSKFLRSAWGAIVENWRAQNVVTVFTRFHPALDNHAWLLECLDAGTPGQDDLLVKLAGETVAIDLTKSPEEIWLGYTRQVRQHVRRCTAQGLTTTLDSGWERLEQFMELYYETMARNHAASFYLFPIEYLRALKNAAGPHAGLMLAMYGNELAAGGVVLEYGGVVDLHLMATSGRLFHLSPSKLLVHEIQRWAQNRGNRLLHLGGGRGSRVDDTLFQFKRHFSDMFLRFNVGRFIINRPAYDALVDERRRCALSDGELNVDYFPAYRASLSRQATASDGFGEGR